MSTQKKRPIVAAIGRQATKVAAQGTFSLPHTAKACKRFMCLLGCFFAALTAFAFFCAPFEPGEVSFSAGWALAATAGWLCRELYRMAGGECQ